MILSVVNVLSTAIKANAAVVLQMLDKLPALGVEQRAIVEAVLELEDSAATGVAGGDMMNTRGTTEMGKSTKFMMNMDVVPRLFRPPMRGVTAPASWVLGDDELRLQDAFSSRKGLYGYRSPRCFKEETVYKMSTFTMYLISGIKTCVTGTQSDVLHAHRRDKHGITHQDLDI
ncbi:hypothetical protein LENED_009903 [Lentinula edodes]|uniref:Uncharacterized protein n=1 Tax=Lentinula edodes TaxID=5353 RepID=A0A1Q3EL19_LENED|nr:hypothetical protein LENED_009903 [Lentinula edodes]